MATVLFVDDRPNEVCRQWQLSGCDELHQLLPVEPFESIAQTVNRVESYRPEVIVIGYGLSSNVTGADVVTHLKQNGCGSYFIGNSGGGSYQFGQSGVNLDAYASRSPQELKRALANLPHAKKESNNE